MPVQLTISVINLANKSAVLTLEEQLITKLPVGTYRHQTLPITEACLQSSLSLGAFADGQLIGYRLTYLPGMSLENLGYELGMNEQERRGVAQFYGTLLAPEWRGKGLGSQLVGETINLLIERALSCALVTVHPSNLKSMAMQHRHAFEVQKEITSFKGRFSEERIIFLRAVG